MASKKIKKLLKGLGMGAALLGAGKALMNRRDKARQMKEFLATEGGDISNVAKRAYEDSIMRGGKGAVIPNNLPMTSANVQRGLVEAPYSLKKLRAMDQTGTAGDIMGEAAMFKKGGRVGCGKAKRGFGRAMKRGKK